MKTTNKIKLGGLMGALLVSLFSANAYATKPGYTVDQSTDAVTRNSYNECWRTSYFDKAKDGLVECGDAAAKQAPSAVMVPVKEKISLSAEVLFDFDKATLRQDGKKALLEVADKIKAKGAKLVGVEVTGFTDYLGSDKYNQALSERRANTVRNEIVAYGVAPEKVTAVGKGESEAKMTQECQAKKFKKRADLKACLAPDRRVDVDITAQQETMQEKTK
ncbi:OmpA family protein [Microvirgula aerodenitrificans]|uniref:OmpA family protein n=1 Tax=Microvirgula aerodenitrificans TaxID=57480 RepID=UPI00248D4691|nr:OmpA family protein [Microvirgula aerodenitrificans]